VKKKAKPSNYELSKSEINKLLTPLSKYDDNEEDKKLQRQFSRIQKKKTWLTNAVSDYGFFSKDLNSMELKLDAVIGVVKAMMV